MTFRYLPALLPLLMMGGCIEEKVKVYRDLPVELDGTGVEEFLEGDPEIILGVYEEQLFRAYVSGDEAHVIEGFQGGTWVHLSLRATAMRREGVLTAALRYDDAEGDVIGEIQYSVRLTPTREGFLEAYDIPIPVRLDPEQLEALFGHDGFLRVSFTSGERSAEATLVLRMSQG